MNIISLALAAAMTLSGRNVMCEIDGNGSCVRERITHPAPDAQDAWAHIVTGESSGQWQDGSLLVAWTLRAWQVKLGMPPELAGRRWGWNGWKTPTAEAIEAVREVWNQPLSNSPFAFMKDGYFCRHLGSRSDRDYWASIGWTQAPGYTLHLPGTEYEMDCYF